MLLETGLTPALALKAACVGKNAEFRYFKKNMGIKGLMHTYRIHIAICITILWTQHACTVNDKS